MIASVTLDSTSKQTDIELSNKRSVVDFVAIKDTNCQFNNKDIWLISFLLKYFFSFLTYFKIGKIVDAEANSIKIRFFPYKI